MTAGASISLFSDHFVSRMYHPQPPFTSPHPRPRQQHLPNVGLEATPDEIKRVRIWLPQNACDSPGHRSPLHTPRPKHAHHHQEPVEFERIRPRFKNKMQDNQKVTIHLKSYTSFCRDPRVNVRRINSGLKSIFEESCKALSDNAPLRL